MNASPDLLPTSVNGRLADYFAGQKECVIDQWLDRVRRDTAIPTEALSIAALKNHLPQLFDDLIGTFRSYGSEAVAEQAVKDAVSHGTTRWRQGFQLKEVLRELMHLRTGLIYHLCQFESLNPQVGVGAHFFVLTTVHRFLDELAMDATEQFLIEEDHARHGR